MKYARRRRGAAAVGRRGRRAGLPLRDVVAGVRAPVLRLFRPARSQSAVPDDGDRPAGVDRARQRAGQEARTRAVGDRRDQAAVDVLRHAGRRPVPPDPFRVRRDPARARLPPVASRRTSIATPRTCSPVTAQAFDEYHRLFGYRYPFGEYHQVFVPDFNLGAMENPGCVTVRRHPGLPVGGDRRRAQHPRADRRARAGAHVVRRPVTMKWWNDLWLNESFAEYMAHRVSHDVTDHRGHWEDFGYVRKWWGLQADQRSSTHPVASDPVKDARETLDDFDGISYAKGAAVLKQLAAYLGDEVFLRGVNAHLGRARVRQRGPAGVRREADRGRRRRARRVVRAVAADGRAGHDQRRARTADGVVLQDAPPDDAERPHRLTVGAYDESGPADVGRRVAGRRRGRRALDPSARARRTGRRRRHLGEDPSRRDQPGEACRAVLPLIADGTTRAVIWNSIRDPMADADLNPQQALEILLEALPAEDSDIAVGSLLRWARRAPARSEPSVRAVPRPARRALTERSRTPARQQPPVGRSRAESSPRLSDSKLLQTWLGNSSSRPGNSSSSPTGLAGRHGPPLGPRTPLVRLGVYGKAEIDAELAQRPLDRRHGPGRAMLAAAPDGKEAAWKR